MYIIYIWLENNVMLGRCGVNHIIDNSLLKIFKYFPKLGMLTYILTDKRAATFLSSGYSKEFNFSFRTDFFKADYVSTNIELLL